MLLNCEIAARWNELRIPVELGDVIPQESKYKFRLRRYVMVCRSRGDGTMDLAFFNPRTKVKNAFKKIRLL